MSELVRLASTFQEDSAFATPQQRALILTQLIDRLIKLDAHLDPYTPMYQSPDGNFVPLFIGHKIEELPDDDTDLCDEEEDDIDAQAYNHPESETETSLSPSLF